MQARDRPAASMPVRGVLVSVVGLMLLSLPLQRCVAWDDGDRASLRAAGEDAPSQGWAVRILSPFSYEPLEPHEFEVRTDISALPAKVNLVFLVNGVQRMSHELDSGAESAREWTWRPGEAALSDLDGFNGLEVRAVQTGCSKTTGEKQVCPREGDCCFHTLASASLDFELVRFTELLYSGACPAASGPSEGNISQQEARKVLRGREAATAGTLKKLAPMVARRLEAHQNRGRHCPIARFAVWNSFGVHGFGSQVQALRIGLEYGFRTNRVVVQNPEFETQVVQQDLQLRFAEHSSPSGLDHASGTLPASDLDGWGLTGLYWDNLMSDRGAMHTLSECQDQVTKWLWQSTSSDSAVAEQVVEAVDDDELLPNNLLQLHPVQYGKSIRAGLVRPPAELVRSVLYDDYFEVEASPSSHADNTIWAGGGEQEGADEPETGEWQGKDVYWWALFSNSFLLRPKPWLLDKIRAVRGLPLSHLVSPSLVFLSLLCLFRIFTLGRSCICATVNTRMFTP